MKFFGSTVSTVHTFFSQSRTRRARNRT
uniref:Uncharacterized protein n=1 Tax=Anopheles funestus TaxID=62324 RepID=A0A182S4C8_ANOFN